MNQEKIGRFIKQLRIDNGMTQGEFAEKLMVTSQAVSKWENGKSLPDIVLINEIAKIFDITVAELLSGEKNVNDLEISPVVEKSKSKFRKWLIALIVVGLILIGVLVVNHLINDKKKENFDFKVIKTSCENFNITGSIAYNKNKSYIYISGIDFCGEDSVVYSKIECTLYEESGNIRSKIDTCDIGYNETLKEHLKDVKISASNYKSICDRFETSELYLEIAATLGDKVTTYKIPLKLDDSCK